MRHERFGIAERPTGTERIAARADWLARFAALLLILSVAAHRFDRIATPEFFWLLAIGGLIPAIVLMMAAAALRRAWRHGERGFAKAIRAGLIALVILAPYSYCAWLIARFPALDDVSTDPADPPLFSTLAMLRKGDMNRIDPIGADEARRQSEAFPEVTGRRYQAAPDTVDEAVAAVIAKRGWMVLATRRMTDPAIETTVEAVARSPIVGYRFDVAVRSTDEGETTYVDMRSSSRYGAHDLGANAGRIIGFLSDLDAEIASRAGG
jgi:hypothetical protein